MFNIDKSDFIEFSLQPFIQRLDERIESLSYNYNSSSGSEACIIRYKNKIKRSAWVDITKKDEKAITTAVIKTL